MGHPYRELAVIQAPGKLSLFRRFWCKLGFHTFKYSNDIENMKRDVREHYGLMYSDGRHPMITYITTLEHCKHCKYPRRGLRIEYDRPNEERYG